LANSPTRVDLIRHAQDESARTTPTYHPRPDSPLTSDGLNQAHATGTTLPRRYTGIVSSPLLRATQTAQAIAETSGIPLLGELPQISEWRPPSCVYGKTPAQYDEDYRTWRYTRSQRPDLAYHDGESLRDLHTRASLAATELRRLADDTGPLLVVSHKVFLGVLTHQDSGPAEAFKIATEQPWPHCDIHTLTSHSAEET
jgi:broad specificity phosphatase PhoE